MISAVILTKNEEVKIAGCIQSVLWCDEVVVVDDYSTDNTVKVVKRLGATVYKRHLNNDFSEQRNYGLMKARNEWVLFVDSDEIVTALLRDEIQKETKQTKYNGFYIKRQDFFLGKQLKHGETGQVKLVRLGRKSAGRWERKVHETWEIQGEIREFENVILHDPHRTLTDFVKKINKYSTMHAEENKKEGKQVTLWNIVLFPVGKFLQNYILRLGFLDGIQGLIMAVMMSWHSFLSWSKQWFI